MRTRRMYGAQLSPLDTTMLQISSLDAINLGVRDYYAHILTADITALHSR